MVTAADIARVLMQQSPARMASTPSSVSEYPVRGPSMTARQPDLRERVGNAVYDVFGSFGLSSIANRARNEAQTGVDFVPVLGDAIGFDDARQAFNAGDYGEAALNAGASLVGAIPGGGDVAASLIKAAPFIPPGASDRLKTGWVFRDVQSPNKELTRSDNKQISNYVGVREETVPVRSLYATQETVNPDFMTTESSSGELPFVLRKNGKLYAQDGHHRIMRAANEGSDNVRVRFMDLDRADTETPLLDYRAATPEQRKRDADLLNELLGIK